MSKCTSDEKEVIEVFGHPDSCRGRLGTLVAHGVGAQQQVKI